MRRSALRQDLKELAWAVLLVDVVVGLTAALMASYLGPRTALLIGGGFAALVVVTIGVIAAGNLLVIYLFRVKDGAGWRSERRERRTLRWSGWETTSGASGSRG